MLHPTRTGDIPRFIYINGFPGVGKLTVAQELQKLIPRSRIFHNHLLIDPVTAIIDRDSPEYHEVRASVRQHLLSIIATSEATKGITWIFTDSRSSEPIGISGARDYKLAAEQRGADFIPVVLTCSLEENISRVISEARRSTAKLIDSRFVQQIRQQEVIHSFGGQELELELNVTRVSASEAALSIFQHVNKFNSTFS
ncbi:hypothetical protein CPLU01_01058 [Colletotrichum plurivorum]|uniref:Uncharacterized protein n=1 Tax=Colletotrichum plurivorum TaxID=2175906 RepID=A0A8H6NQG3_9PEZI|nr:hypothetical protein CPLU01_01058 [Colletotrichum plurivorum]